MAAVGDGEILLSEVGDGMTSLIVNDDIEANEVGGGADNRRLGRLRIGLLPDKNERQENERRNDTAGIMRRDSDTI